MSNCAGEGVVSATVNGHAARAGRYQHMRPRRQTILSAVDLFILATSSLPLHGLILLTLSTTRVAG